VVKNVRPSSSAFFSLGVLPGKTKASRSPDVKGNGPTTPYLSRGTRFTGFNTVPAGGTAMSKIPDPGSVGDKPRSTSRCARRSASLGLPEPTTWADAGDLRVAIAVAAVSTTNSLCTITSLQNPA